MCFQSFSYSLNIYYNFKVSFGWCMQNSLSFWTDHRAPNLFSRREKYAFYMYILEIVFFDGNKLTFFSCRLKKVIFLMEKNMKFVMYIFEIYFHDGNWKDILHGEIKNCFFWWKASFIFACKNMKNKLNLSSKSGKSKTGKSKIGNIISGSRITPAPLMHRLNFILLFLTFL